MLIAFIDESYELGAGDIYLLAAVVCDGASLARLESGLDATVVKATSDFGISKGAELHGYDLYQGDGDWTPVAAKPRARIGIYGSAFDAIHASEAQLFACSTRPSKLKTADPHELCLRYLLEMLDEYAERQEDYLVVICDDVDSRLLHRRDLDNYKTYGTAGWKHRQLTRILDTMHFGDSAESRGLQAADLVAFLRRRLERHLPSSSQVDAANRQVWCRLDLDRLRLKNWYPM